MDTSNAETGSSHITSSGFNARDLAIPILCRCPPLKAWGYLIMYSGLSPTASISSATLSSNSDPFAILLTNRGSPIISFTVILGFNEEYGSWNIICMCFLSSFNSFFSSDDTSTTSPFNLKYTSPSVGSIALIILLPVVVLPLPDSPTSPSVSPFFIKKLTSSTAFTHPTVLLKKPFWIGKCFFNPFT